MIEVILGALTGVGLWYGAPFDSRKVSERALARRCRAQRAVVLSYDDGPGPDLTPRLLDLLGERGATASFFALGGRLAESAPIGQRILAEGHELGHHTQAHSNAWRVGPRRWSRDFEEGRRRVTEAGGDPRLFRPPFGKLTISGAVQTWRKKCLLGWWTVDSRDSWARRPVRDVISEIDAKGGGVVLMHDWDEYESNGSTDGISHADHVMTLTTAILDHAAERGYRVVRYSDLW